eukprot:3109722-Pyramimonas_sp.AAC.6
MAYTLTGTCHVIAQGDKMEELGMLVPDMCKRMSDPVKPFAKCQLGFFDYIWIPFLRTWTTVRCVYHC